MTLSPHHYVMLRNESAIADEVIATRGYRSLAHPDDLQDLGFSKAQARTAPVLAIPLWDVHGHQTGWQIRPDSPRQGKDGKVFKYETPKGGRVSLDVHPSMQPLLGDPGVPLWITEGVKKGDALTSHGACAIALMGGVWGFRGTNEHKGKVILPAWEHVALNGRLVYVAYDSDITTKPHVEAALKALWRFLRDRQALPARVHWPEEFQQQKWGIDDFFAHGHTLADALAMIPPIGPLPTTSHPRRNGTAPAPTAQPWQNGDAGGVGGDQDKEPHWPLPFSDTYNARAMVGEYGQDLHYCWPWRKWLVWTGTHWHGDDAGAVRQKAKQTIKRLARLAEDLDDAAAQALMTHIKKSLSTAAIKAMIEGAQDEPGIPVLPDALDVDPWLLCCSNGTLDLRTGILRQHDRADLLTRRISVAHDNAARCPTWEAFLDRIMAGNQNLITFLQRAIGYALTGVIREHVLLILWGTGRNGKSTFLNTLRALLGPYAMKASSELLMVSNNDRHPTERADLCGKRFVSAIETEQGRKLAEVFVKEATGGDPIRVRRMREDFWEFQPTHKVLLATNHKPIITGTDTAIWERIRLVPFSITIPPGKRDATLPEKLEQEFPGILNWALQGCRAWQEQGLGVPDEVQQATAGYRTEMDVLGQFIDECCLKGPKYQAKATDLYNLYKTWCDQQGVGYAVQRTWGMWLTERGFERYTNNGTWYRGLGIREHADEPTEPTEPTEGKNGIHSSTNPSRDENRKVPSVPSVPSVSTHPEGVATLSGTDSSAPTEAEAGGGIGGADERAAPAAVPGVVPCFACRGTTYWYNALGMQICARCHPAPTASDDGIPPQPSAQVHTNGSHVPTPAFTELTASCLWCGVCQQALPARLQDTTYYCAVCGAVVGAKTTHAPNTEDV
jgi:P4 family phage/plasmid primase-like protien